MAVESYFTNYDQQAAEPKMPTLGNGVFERRVQNTVSIAVADSDGSTYLLFKDVPGDIVIGDLSVENDDLHSSTADYDIGLYDSETGEVIVKDCYANGMDLGTAHTKATALNGMHVLTHENTLKRVFEVAGHTLKTRKAKYDLVLTANTVGDAAGKVTVRGTFLPAA